jgi:thiamine biosynthesis protein ThiI
MSYDSVVIHYSEIILKGKNRRFFENKLLRNIKKVVPRKYYNKISFCDGRIVLELNSNSNKKVLERKLKKVFGIDNFAFCYSSKLKINDIKRIVGEIISKKVKDIKTIKVETARAYKKFPLTSLDVNKKIGSYLVKNFNLKVSMKNPDLKIYVEITKDRVFVYTEKIKGLTGLPVGVTGKVVSLISGGIDSPVASWLMLKRGCSVIFLHFYAYRNPSEVMKTKIKKIMEILSEYSISAKLYLIPFYIFQVEATKLRNPKYELISFRRFMVRVAEEIARKEGAKAIVTGDSLGQVASQTLENLIAVNDATSLPIFRPLLGYTKNEIIKMAKKIGTYDVSIKKYKDCCSIISRHPATKVKIEKIRKLENRLDLEKVKEESIKLSKVFVFENGSLKRSL